MNTIGAVEAELPERRLVRRLCAAVGDSWLTYGFALAAHYLFFGFTSSLGSPLCCIFKCCEPDAEGDIRGFVLFLLAVILSAYIGGVGPGLLSTQSPPALFTFFSYRTCTVITSQAGGTWCGSYRLWRRGLASILH